MHEEMSAESPLTREDRSNDPLSGSPLAQRPASARPAGHLKSLAEEVEPQSTGAAPASARTQTREAGGRAEAGNADARTQGTGVRPEREHRQQHATPHRTRRLTYA